MFTNDELNSMMRGDAITIGNKRYMFCPSCLRPVKVNKAIIGSAHLCAASETEKKDNRELYARWVKAGMPPV